jgi:CBS domain-containing membrane protein
MRRCASANEDAATFPRSIPVGIASGSVSADRGACGRRLALYVIMTSTNHRGDPLEGNRASLAAPTTLAEVMTTMPHTIHRDQRLSLARDVLRENDLRHLPVLEDGRLVGLLSRSRLYRTHENADRVGDAMATNLYVVAPGDCVADVARLLAGHELGCAVVVDRGHVVGLFTAGDAIGLLEKGVA